MNNRMYEHGATQENLATLRRRGALIVEPDAGRLASKGEHGVGRLAEPARLLAACEQALAASPRRRRGSRAQSMRGLRVLITAGGTREPIDSVRFIGNSSSGRMGLALAAGRPPARRRGHPRRGQRRPARAGGRARAPVAHRSRAAGRRGEEFDGCDVLLMAAAVADFAPPAPAGARSRRAAGSGSSSS